MSNSKDYLQEIKLFIEGGRNDNSRHLSHATYAVKTTDAFDQEIYGVQYHNTVIFGIREDGTYFFNNGDYFTVTTKKRINDCLIKVGNYHQIVQRNHKWIINGDQLDFGFMLFDVDNNMIHSSTIDCWAMNVKEVVAKNSKITNYYLSKG